jgi:hypothetical protein
MKTKSPSRNESRDKISKIYQRFNGKWIIKISRVSRFKQRERGIISAKRLILGFMTMVSRKMNTYEAWAQEISLSAKKTVSKQAIEERMNPETTTMLKMVLEEELRKSILYQQRLQSQTSHAFHSIHIEDSTIFNLPAELSFAFPGNVSLGNKKSQVKIHTLYNHTNNSFGFLDLYSFTRNDQSLSSRILSYIQPGDLILRDMGFLVLDVLGQINAQGSFFISRKKSQIQVFDIDTHQEINLVDVLRKKNFFDKDVLVGKANKIKMRLIAIPLPPDQASSIRRKAKKNRDKRLKHDKEYYELLGYNIFITNLAQSRFHPEEIQKLYGLRWQIEIIFKTWKSCFSMGKLMPVKCINPYRIYCLIYLWLLFILLFQTEWFNHYLNAPNMKYNLSLMKMGRFFSLYFDRIVKGDYDNFIRKLIISKCRYEKRNDRLTMLQKYEKIAA